MRAAGRVRRPLPQPLGHDHRRRQRAGHGGDQCVQAADAVVAKPGTLLGVAVHRHHGVIDIDDRQVPDPDGDRGPCGKPGQEPGGDRVELPDVSEGERPQERPQRRRGIAGGEHPAHAAVPQQRHVIDRVRTRDHPAHQRGDLQPRVGALVGRHREVLIGQAAQTSGLGQREHRHQAAGRHQIRIVEHRGS